MPTPQHPERVWYAPAQAANGAGILQVSADCWASYLGFVDAPVTLNRLEVLLTVNAVGTQVAEHGLFSSPLPPNGAAQTLTKLVASGSLTSMTSGAVKVIQNTAAFATVIPPGTFLWGVTRYAFTSTPTQPTIAEGTAHSTLGDSLYLTGASALTSVNTLVMTLPTMAVVNHVPPFCWATED